MIVVCSRMFTHQPLVRWGGDGSTLKPVIPPRWMAYVPHNAEWTQAKVDKVNNEEPGEWLLDSWQSDGQKGVVICWRFEV